MPGVRFGHCHWPMQHITHLPPSELTLILLPGMDGTGSLFGPVVEALAGQCTTQVVMYPVDQAFAYAELIRFVRAALPVGQRFLLLGESFSGPIAVSLAAERPPGLLGLILCCTFVRNPQPLFRPLRSLANFIPFRNAPIAVLDYFLLGPYSTPILKAALSRALSMVAPATLQARLKAVLGVDVTEQLSTLQIPVLCLRATHDRVVPRAAATHIQAHCPGMVLVQVEGPHCLLQASPGKTAEAILAFGRAVQRARD